MIGTQSVPVTMGSPTFRSMTLDGFEVIEAWFPPRGHLARHTHDRGCVAMMLEGSFDLAMAGRVHSCPPTAVATEPAGERHANRMGDAGAHVVVIQPDPRRTEMLHPFARLLDQPSHRHHAGVTRCAARLARELDRPDHLAALAAEARRCWRSWWCSAGSRWTPSGRRRGGCCGRGTWCTRGSASRCVSARWRGRWTCIPGISPGRSGNISGRR